MMRLPFEQFPALSAIEICRHVFTQRIPGIQISHNKAEVLERLEAAHLEIRGATGLGDGPLFTAQQIHGNKIAVIDSQFHRLSPLKRGEDEGERFEGTAPRPSLRLSLANGEAPEAARSEAKNSQKSERFENGTEFPGCDGIITDQCGVALGIYVADCCAVYIVDPKRPAIGLVHSGRKGTELGVVSNAIQEMIDRFGSDPAQLIVQLSPCIRPPHYEIDFAAEILRQCHALDVPNIHDCGMCTACDLQRYYSYRAEKGRTGRMLAVLALDPAIGN